MNELEQLIAIYQKAQQRLLELAVNTKGKGTAHYYKRLGADVNNIILDLKVASRRYAGTNIPKEYFYGVKKAVDGLKALGIHLGGTYAFAKGFNPRPRVGGYPPPRRVQPLCPIVSIHAPV
jgi:pyruvate-formate lyase-activating enzyme